MDIEANLDLNFGAVAVPIRRAMVIVYGGSLNN
jgi:hypothetical protein